MKQKTQINTDILLKMNTDYERLNKKIIKNLLFICLFFTFYGFIKAGEILPGSVPGSINYQGRLEQDNAPVTGPRILKFRIYNQETGGTLLWESNYITVQVVGGIFSASFSPDITKLGTAQQLYLEVEVQGETLTPREPIRSVLYSLVAKKLEDGGTVTFSTVNISGGAINLAPGTFIKFSDASFLNSAYSLTVQGHLSNTNDVMINSDSGDIIFYKNSSELMRLKDGNLGIGTSNPSEKLYVVGNSSTTGNIYLGGVFNNGFIPGANSESIKLGVENDVISFLVNGSEKMRIQGGNVGINKSNPSYTLDVNGDINSNTGIKGGDVSIGSFSGGTADTNEIRATGDLIFQKSNPSGKVGIGLTNPSEKLHVLGNIKANYGIVAATANFSSDVNIDGNLIANGFNKQVILSSTTIYGRLQVYGPVASAYGDPAYIASSNTFTGYNIFSNYVKVSSEVIVNYRLGVGMSDFDFPSSNYLQIGDKDGVGNMDAIAYLVSRNAGNSKIYFYRGNYEAARLETLSGNNLSLSIVGDQKAYIDSSKFKIQSSNFIVSPTGSETTPSIYVSSSNSNVGIKTTNTPYELTVAGSIKLVGSGSAIIFDDGSSLSSRNSGTADSVSNNNDAVILADADRDATGKVILKAGNNIGLVVNSNGQVGVGELNPTSKFQLVGGDMMIGNTSNPLASNGQEDLIVAGSLIVDGSIQQRSTLPANFSALTVSGNVFLSTSASATTSIGTDSAYPAYRLYVNGNIGINGAITQGSWQATKIDVQYGGTGATSFTSGGILYGNGTGAIKSLPQMGDGGIVIGGPLGSLSTGTITGTLNQVNVTNGPGTIRLSLPQDIHSDANPTFSSLNLTNGITASSGTFTYGIKASTGIFIATGANQYSIETSSGIKVSTGVVNLNNSARIINLLDPVSNQDAATKKYVDDQLGSGNTVVSHNSTLTGSGTISSPLGINLANANTWTAHQTFNSGITASSGIFTQTTDYSIKTSSGIKINAGVITCTDCIALGAATTGNYVSNITAGTGISVTGTAGEGWSPAVSLTGQALAIHNLNSNGIVVRTSANNFAARTIRARSTKISITNENGVLGDPTIDVNEGSLSLNDIGGTLTPSQLEGVFSSNGVLVRTGAATYTTTSGLTGSYTVVVDTFPATCQSWTFTNGVLTNVASVTCP